MVWQSPDNIPNHNGGYVTRNLIIDRQGVLWFANGGHLVGYVHHLDEIEAGANMVAPFPEQESSETGHLQALAFSATRDTVVSSRRPDRFHQRKAAAAHGLLGSSSGQSV